MKRSIVFWILAFVITAASAVYQRVTGPTYPMRGHANVGGHEIGYSLDRSHGGMTNHPVEIQTDDPSIAGILTWRRFKTNDVWTATPMVFNNGVLSAELPYQPPAGKLEYRVSLSANTSTAIIPAEQPVVIRFKGEVPMAILIVHIAAMFTGMLFSTRTAFEVFSREPQFKKLTTWTFGLLLFGGFMLGPVVQWYAFGKLWTGWPFGGDLTDNKTALTIFCWAIAMIAVRKAVWQKGWVLIASAVTFFVFLIPHSMFGSELDYSKIDQQSISAPR